MTQRRTPKDEQVDATLHLLDRQIVDVDGRMVAKVDDVELTEAGDDLVVTGLLCGLGALLPRSGRRLGPWLNRRYSQVSVSHAARRAPAVVDIDLVDAVESAVRLAVPRAGLLRPRVEPAVAPVRRTIGDLIDLPVHLVGREGAAGRRPRVLDVRLECLPGGDARCAVSGLLVGAGRPGALLGYDRGNVQAPAPLAAVVRRLHRHSRRLTLGAGVELDWEAGVVRVAESVALRSVVAAHS